MKIKIKYLLIFLFIILIMFSLVSVSSCRMIEYLFDKLSPDYDDSNRPYNPDPPDLDEILDEEEKIISEAVAAAEDELKTEEKERKEGKQSAKGAELKEEFEDYPEIITLKGSIWEGSKLILIIDMDTRDVEGSVTFKDSNNTYNGKITEGGIDLSTYEITADCCGLWEDKMYPDVSGDKCIDIRGQLSKDYKMASGIAEVWTGPNEWIARSGE